MQDIEKEMKRSTTIREETMNLRQKEKELQDQSKGRNKSSDQPKENLNYTSDWAKKLAAMEKQKEKETTQVPIDVTPSHWMERLDPQDNTDGEKESEAKKREKTQNGRGREETDKLEDERRKTIKTRKKKTTGMKKLRRWFGDETTDSGESSEDNSDEEKWDTVTRKKKNREKMKKRKKAPGRTSQENL